jgi:hypothetical protein
MSAFTHIFVVFPFKIIPESLPLESTYVTVTSVNYLLEKRET